ncbi:putative sugar O-methyltransferase [Methylobacterium dankookense]|uniref:Sugar O-methyltransferase n=1 Tax=Methylobacterium dankookense TaxID=560405 RepID=A0A564G7P9_9HYPH|nr:putative sugar O-methyltransferase [Methylobacterium dankookense]GJD59624.1 hypothetical protein IFDJLNFL_5553 [Methylobacterium dankookense]VUF16082.1 hypothetical protein MTDSW087_05833 [Methylobacterium dankookense]
MSYNAVRDWQFHRPYEHTVDDVASVKDIGNYNDAALVSRIIDFYKLANSTSTGTPNHQWHQVVQDKSSIHEALNSGDELAVTQILRDPASNMHFYGFDSLYKGHADMTPPYQALQSRLIYSLLVRLCEAVGVSRLENPEAYNFSDAPPQAKPVEDLLLGLDGAIGCKIDFPNPYPGEIGLPTIRGIATYRSVQAIYQAYRARDLLTAAGGGRVLEIGGGLGRTAYYANRFGIERYTIIDIPMTSVAQAYYLGSTLSSGSLALYGEDASRSINLLPPEAFLTSNEKYDLILNVDSLPEMHSDTSHAYIASIAKRTPIFLSINHEALGLTAREIISSVPTRKVSRFPYWMRRGYVEEIVRF